MSGINWNDTKDIEAAHVSAGYRASLSFDIVPRTKLTFDPPDAATLARVRNASDVLIEVPVRGRAKNFPPGVDVPVTFNWLVTRGGQTLSYPMDKAVMKVTSDGKFNILVDGKTPTIDVVAQQLVNQGAVGYSLTPDFPHAELATFTPAIPFNNTCRINATKPPGNKTLIGERVTFTPHLAGIFNKVELELRVVELDEGSSEVVSGADRYAFAHRWEPSTFWWLNTRGGLSWAIGFTDDSCERFADVGDEEEGSYEFGWQLWARSRPDAPQMLLLEDKEYLKLPKPRLEELKVEYDKSWEGTWEIHGKISGVAPRANLLLEVALVEPAAPLATPQATPQATPLLTPKPLSPLMPTAQATAATTAPAQDRRSAPIRVTLGDDGIFEAHLGERHWMSGWQGNAVATTAPKAYAILSLVAAAREGKPGPIAPYLDFDDAKYSPFKGESLSWDLDSEWVCSEEATSLVARPPKPKRRKTGLSLSPAPGPEVGDQKTPITFEDMWLDIIAWEGVVPYMYLDTEGWVTVGAGNLLKHIEPTTAGDNLAAKTHPFVNMDTGKAATPQEITDAFNKVKAMPAKMFYTEYALRPKIALTDAYIKQLAKTRYETEFLPAVKAGFPDFETYPRAARRGILDVTYNVGVSVPKKWTNLIAAVKARDWQKASVECRTRPQNKEDTRNEWRKALFLHAAKVDWKKKPGT
jgi:GH24 family phage-related lysozyme (muramidase)